MSFRRETFPYLKRVPNLQEYWDGKYLLNNFINEPMPKIYYTMINQKANSYEQFVSVLRGRGILRDPDFLSVMMTDSLRWFHRKPLEGLPRLNPLQVTWLEQVAMFFKPRTILSRWWLSLPCLRGNANNCCSGNGHGFSCSTLASFINSNMAPILYQRRISILPYN